MPYPFVSIIIPNYCHAKYLDQRILSVLGQTYQNFEVIILDDASPDDGASWSVIEKYRDNPHVSQIVYNEQNSGSTFKQWNKGFELAMGDLIWIAESDDYCELNFLETLVECWGKYPNVSVVQSASVLVDQNSNTLSSNRVFSNEEEFFAGAEFIKRRLVRSNFHIPNASAVIFRKDYAMSVKREYMNYKASGDSLFWIYMLEKGNICTIYKPLNFFRQHNNKVSSRKEKDGTQCRENYSIYQYLSKNGYVRTIVKNEAFKFYWNYISTYQFDSEEIRNELFKLWFPWWKRNALYRLYNKLYHKGYTLLFLK